MASTAERPRGYHRLAELMGPYPSAAIFRRFGPLNMLHLLSLQAELVELDAEFRDVWQTDEKSSNAEEKDFSTYFRSLRNSESGAHVHQYHMLVTIGTKLAEYNRALLEAAQVAKLSVPGQNDLNFLRGWLNGKDEGGGFMRGHEFYTYESLDPNDFIACKLLNKDLITINPQASEQDIFSDFITSKLLKWWHDFNYKHLKFRQEKRNRRHATDAFSGAMHYRDSHLARANTIVVSVISSALPVLSIVALYFIKTTIQRIGAIVGFTVVFAFALATFTNARRLEIFATTSTFAAVEVVFIGTVLPGSS